MSLFNLRVLHSSLVALMDPTTPTGGKTVDLPVVGHEELAPDFRFGHSPLIDHPSAVDDEDDDQHEYDDRSPTRPSAVRAGLTHHDRRGSTSSQISSVLSVWYDAEMVPYESDGSDEDDFVEIVQGALRDPLSLDSSDNDTLSSSSSPESTPSYSPPMSTPTFSLLSDTNPRPKYDSDVSSTPSLPRRTHQSTLSDATLSPSSSLDTSFSSAHTSASPPTDVDSKPWDEHGHLPHQASSSSSSSGSGTGETAVPTVEWRTELPAVTPKDEGSLLGVLRKSVGKDMSQISMPVTFNEPLSLLQRSVAPSRSLAAGRV